MSDNEEYVVTCTDERVRGNPGTVARCTCGWEDAWGIQEGNAEASAHFHYLWHYPEKAPPPYVQEKHPLVTRVELIANGGRENVMYGVTDVETHLQDGQRTLKIFVRKPE